MSGEQHKIVGIGFGVAAAYAIMHGYNEPMGIVTAFGSAISCWWPDADHNSTRLGKKRKAAVTVVNNMTNVFVYGGIALGVILAVMTAFGFANYGVSTTHLIVFVVGLLAFLRIRNAVTNSDTYKWSVKHRGIMHTLLVPILLFVLLGASDYPVYRYMCIGFIVGYLSHLFADCITKDKCPLLFPLTKEPIGIGLLATKNKKACDIAAWSLAVGSVVLSYLYF